MLAFAALSPVPVLAEAMDSDSPWAAAGLILGMFWPFIVLLVLLVCGFFWFKSRRKRKQLQMRKDDDHKVVDQTLSELSPVPAEQSQSEA